LRIIVESLGGERAEEVDPIVGWIALATQCVRVEAPRDLCFEVVAAAGKLVEKRSQTERVVEFVSEHKGKTIRTLELVKLEPPERILYSWLKGPLPGVEEEIAFEVAADGCTEMTYRGSFRAGAGSLRWVMGRLYVRRVFDRLVREHLDQGKRAAEQRAARSHVHDLCGDG
jgi:hypothetical protein